MVPPGAERRGPVRAMKVPFLFIMSFLNGGFQKGGNDIFAEFIFN